jgi:hypothetical protein
MAANSNPQLSAIYFASAEDRRAEYGVMKEQTAEGSNWIKYFSVRTKR